MMAASMGILSAAAGGANGVEILIPLAIPLIAGLLCFLLGPAATAIQRLLVLAVSLIFFGIAIAFFVARPAPAEAFDAVLFSLDPLGALIVLGIGFFAVVVSLYCLKDTREEETGRDWPTYFLWTVGAAYGAAAASNLLVLLVFWGIVGLTLYKLIQVGGPLASEAAKKTLVTVGGCDSILILGFALLWLAAGGGALSLGSFDFSRFRQVDPSSGAGLAAFILIALAAVTKAGGMPFHRWLPDSAPVAPANVMAFLPGALDKLLGIYLLGRAALDLFAVRSGSTVAIVLQAAGAVTIVAAVMMALIQHNLRKLLAYHAVSQVGYMILGLGTGTAIGAIGGLFHMLNNAVYKSCLFLAGGAAEERCGTADLDRMGGLARIMPWTFGCFLVAALAISGVPPLNGFFSKWLIYQGIIEGGKGSNVWVIWLVAATFGSALTLASFLKAANAVFLSRPAAGEETRRDADPTKVVPMAALAGLCVVLGVFAYAFPLRLLFDPIRPLGEEPGLWSPLASAGLLALGIGIALALPLLAGGRRIRESEPFVGGEIVTSDMAVSGTDFYRAVETTPGIAQAYRGASLGVFDAYGVVRGAVRYVGLLFSALHSGILPAYVTWVILGLVFLIGILVM
ncbi:MAG: NADH dehydrogenase [Planctomycetes bacterium]|nr:NADH dehydrogenase [Planctomycetota bacterium]